MQEYYPELWEALESTFALSVTDNEATLINHLREKTSNIDPVFDEGFLTGIDELLIQESMA